MKTESTTYVYVTYDGFHGHFGNEGYSKYNHKTREYGYKEALEHIEELKASVYEGRQLYKDKKFFVVTETRVITFLPVS